MNKKRHFRKVISCLCISALLAGCTSAEVQVQSSSKTQTAEPVYTFTLPSYIPLALVDCAGYETGADKTVIFFTKEAGDVFELRNALDDSVVYTGRVKEGKNDGVEISYGQFSSYQLPGEYYIYTDGTGSSYSFSIEDNLNRTKLEEALRRFYFLRCGMNAPGDNQGSGTVPPCHTQAARLRNNPDIEREVYGGHHTDAYGGRDVRTSTEALRDLLLLMEMNPKKAEAQVGEEVTTRALSIKDEILYEAAWLLRMQDENGGVYSGVLTGGNEMSANLTLTEITPEATISFAGVMARAAYVLRGSDASFAEEALAAAKEAWEYYVSHSSPLNDSKAFAAASELYRMTGERKYENVLSAFFSKEDFTERFMEDDEIFYGSFSYMGTKQPVNVEVCNTIMTVLLKNADAIAGASNASSLFVSAEETDALLKNTMRLSVANHVIYNHEYTSILEDHIHYLYGRNPKALNLVTGEQRADAHGFEESCIYARTDRLSRFILLLLSV